MIANTLSSRKNREYHKVTAGDFDNTIVNEKKREARLYYVVLPSTDANADELTNNCEDCLDKYFNINYNSLMSEIVALQKEKGIDILPSYEIKKLLLSNSSINKRNVAKMVRNNNDVENIEDDMVVDTNTEEKIDLGTNDEENDNSGNDSDGDDGDDDLAIDKEDNNNNKMEENDMEETINTNEIEKESEKENANEKENEKVKDKDMAEKQNTNENCNENNEEQNDKNNEEKQPSEGTASKLKKMVRI